MQYFYPFWDCEAAYIHDDNFFISTEKHQNNTKTTNGPDHAQHRSCLICTSEKKRVSYSSIENSFCGLGNTCTHVAPVDISTTKTFGMRYAFTSGILLSH